MQFRPAQRQILEYSGGYMAISAVPGSGKTTTLAALAAHLIDESLPPNGSVLVVTYLHAAVDNLRSRIADMLNQRGRVYMGCYIRTLHSLAYEIIHAHPDLAGIGTEFDVLDGRRQREVLNRVTQIWIRQNQSRWRSFLVEGGETMPPWQERMWRDTTERVVATVIDTAKNWKLGPADIQQRHEYSRGAAPPQLTGLSANSEDQDPMPLLRMATEIYALYQEQLQIIGALDFNDLIWRSVATLQAHPHLAEELRRRWPYILEDESQDSVPLQQELISLLAGPGGNWVRVGDPNQAITSTFTAAHPLYFRSFIQRPDVQSRTLPNSGRSALKIINLANYLVDWTTRHHPLPWVQRNAFVPQEILPVPAGDRQQNPDDSTAHILIKGYDWRESGELPDVVKRAVAYSRAHPEDTLAILVPTNDLGYKFSEALRTSGVRYEEMLRSSSRAREVAELLAAVLGYLADPLAADQVLSLYDALRTVKYPGLEGPESNVEHVRTLLRSVYQVESLAYPPPGQDATAFLPQVSHTTQADRAVVQALSHILRRVMAPITLPVDQLVVAVAQDLLSNEAQLATAQRLATYLRRLADTNPQWRLPELAIELSEMARGRGAFDVREDDGGFAPEPGVITLTTHHSAKGLEWDLVYLVGMDSSWLPDDLSGQFVGRKRFLGNIDPNEEAKAELQTLMGLSGWRAQAGAGASGEDVDFSLPATDLAGMETICERLRLLYVGITRARRLLQISWSDQIERPNGKPIQGGLPLVLKVLDRHMRQQSMGSI